MAAEEVIRFGKDGWVGWYKDSKDRLWESAGKQHVTTTLLKGTLDGSKGSESQGRSWFGGGRGRSKIVAEKLGKKQK